VLVTPSVNGVCTALVPSEADNSGDHDAITFGLADAIVNLFLVVPVE